MNLINKLITSSVLSFFILAGGCSGQREPIAQRKQGVEEHYVKRVVDGDTLVLDDGRYVRLLGIDTPELKKKGQKHPERFAVEASDKLDKLVGGERKIRLEYDLQDENDEDKDRFGRTLGYIIADGRNTSIILLGEGYARAFMHKGLKYEKEILEAEREAREFKRGIWLERYAKP